jgi:hypothetical protein
MHDGFVLVPSAEHSSHDIDKLVLILLLCPGERGIPNTGGYLQVHGMVQWTRQWDQDIAFCVDIEYKGQFMAVAPGNNIQCLRIS